MEHLKVLKIIIFSNFSLVYIGYFTLNQLIPLASRPNTARIDNHGEEGLVMGENVL